MEPQSNKMEAPDTVSLLTESEELAECHGDLLTDLEQSMWDMFYSTAIKYPHRQAVISIWQPKTHLRNLLRNSLGTNSEQESSDDSEEAFEWTYKELLEAVEVVAGWLQSQGCCEGDYLVTFLWNSAEWVLFFWVAARLKMPFIPLDPRTLDQDAAEYIARLNPSVIVVQDQGAAEILQRALLDFRAKVQISCQSSPSESWTSLLTLQRTESTISPSKNSESAGQEIALIVFTSGTTSAPKGCCHTSANLWSQCYDFDPDKDLIERWLVHTPVSHIFAVNNSLRSFRYGGTVVFASKTFNIHASLKALEEYQCTRMSAVPTLVQALLSLPTFPGKDKLALHYVSFGGTVIKEEDIRMCKELGSDAVVQVYGMSEGAPITSWLRNDPLLVSGHYPGVGKALPGSRIRICPPGSREVLRRNVPGELHIGGTAVISGYLNVSDSESFYTDQYGSWLRTGDQAKIDGNGVVQILGRYKDLIIRGGENIAPVKIEECLGQVSGLLAQVVGLADNIAGEVPVAVVQSLMSRSKADIMQLAKSLGPSYALAAVITLEELGLEKYPLTSAGKVRKNVLRELVAHHFNTNSTFESQKSFPPGLATPPISQIISSDPQTHESTLVDNVEHEDSTKMGKIISQLIEIWETLVVSPPSKNDSVYDFADSISLLRYCDKVWRVLGKKLYLQDFTKHDTVERQAELLQQREGSPQELGLPASSFILSPNEMTRSKNGPPAIGDMVHANGDSQRFIETRLATAKVLTDFGMSWDNDVEDIIPIKDLFYPIADGPRPQSYRHRISFRVVGKSPETIRIALEKGLESRPILRTFLVKLPDKTPVHTVIRPGKALYDILISEKQCNENDVQDMILNHSGETFSRVLMLQVIIAHSEEYSTIIMTYNHSVFDAMSMVPWMRDLDLLMTNPETALLASTPFKLFADMAYSHRESMPATLDVQYFAKRFAGISKQTRAFWPQQRAPGWMIGTDRDSVHRAARDQVRQAEPIRRPRVWTKSKVTHMAALKAKNIQPFIVVKTAIALFNIQQTGQEYAIFNTIDAGRSWPFMPAWIPLPPAMSIDGPTIEWTGNMIRILPEETVEQLLERMRQDQEELSLHAHAPMFRVMDELGTEGPFLTDAMVRQTFNWDISLQYLKSGNSYGDIDLTSLELIDRVDWPDSGFLWDVGMTSADELCVLATWDDAQLSLKEAEQHVKSLTDVIQLITDPDNWSKTIRLILHT